MPVRLTIQDLHKRLLRSDIACLDRTYRNPYLKMKFKCSEGHVLNTSWSEVQRLIGQKHPHCPICKHGENFFDKYEGPKKKKAEYKSVDGKVFSTRKELTHHNRKLKARSSLHEMTIETLRSTLKHSRTYGFSKSIIE